MRFLISGGSGLIGQGLIQLLKQQQHEVVQLVRRNPGTNQVQWRIDQPPTAAVANADVVVNLSGAGVGDRRWTEAYRREIMSSRVTATRSLATAIADAGHQPVFVSMSAVGIYGNRPTDTPCDEQATPANTFLARVVQAWENATEPADAAGSRVVMPRMSMVLDSQLGALPKLLKVYRLGLGGPLGSGKQHWPWISSRDAVRAILWLAQSELAGPVNVVSPQLITNSQFNRALGKAVHRPALLPVPGFALRIVLGGFGTELVANQPVAPARLQAAGFDWLDRDITATLTALASV